MRNPEIFCRLGTGIVLITLVTAVALMFLGFWMLGIVMTGIAVGVTLIVSSKAVFWWPRKPADKPVVLMLHSVNDRIVNSVSPNNSIRPLELERLIKNLLAAGYIFQTLRDAKSKSVSQRIAVLTFDDGYTDNFTELLPILRRFNVPATLFVTDRRDQGFLTDVQIRELMKSGLVELGGHTSSHCDLTSCDTVTLAKELTDNKAELERITGQKVVSFAYPCGFYGPRERAAVAAAGFLYAVTTKKKAPAGNDPLQVPRQIIPRGLSPFRMYIVASRGRARL